MRPFRKFTMRRFGLVPLLCVAALLGACGTGADDPAAPAGPILADEADGGAEAEAGGEPADLGSETAGADGGEGVGTAGPILADEADGGAEAEAGGEPDDTDSGAAGADAGEIVGTAPDVLDGDDGEDDRDVFIGDDEDGGDDDRDVFIGGGGEGDSGTGDGFGDGLEPGVVLPGVAGNVEATRLLFGLSRALEATLVELNTRLREGVPLTPSQQDCLGAYDPASGEPAFSVECARPLSTDGVAVYVQRGAFFPTAACAVDLAAGTADRCVMASAVTALRTQFAIVPGRRLPQPLRGTGVVVGYALDRPALTLVNDESGVFGLVDCEFALQNGALLPSIGGVDGCQALVRDVAERIELALPVL